MPVFFIASGQVKDGLITVTQPLLDHLGKSLRITAGEDVWFGDEHRRRYRARVRQISKRAMTAEVLEQCDGPAPSGPPLILAPAILKGERMDWLLQKATELGVSAFQPIVTRRGVVRPKADRQTDARWQRIVLEAAQQSERWDVPRIEPVQPWNSFYRNAETAERLILVERRSGTPLRGGVARVERPILLAIGPEGGWDPGEIENARTAGFQAVTLGEQILRAETAALAAITLVQHQLGRI